MAKPKIAVATVILAGGQGTRLHPLTMNHSKPAVSYGGRYRLIDIPISNSINSDFRQIFVIAQYLSGELQHHIGQAYHFDAFNPGSIDVLTPQEDAIKGKQWFMGTADAVRKNLPTLLQSSADYFLILSGDQLYNINFQDMVSFAVASQAELTIASIPVCEKDAYRMGLLQIDEKCRVKTFVEKPSALKELTPFKVPNTDRYLASMGIYVFERKALVELLESDKRDDFGYHLIQTAVKREKTSAFLYSGYWEDIGTVASYYDANLLLTRSNRGLDTYDEYNPIYTRQSFLPGPKIHCTQINQSIVCEGSQIYAQEITGSVIGLRSHIGKGTIIQDSVLMGNHFSFPETSKKTFGIGKNCHIKKAIIDEQVEIGDHVQLINQQNLEHYEGNGVFVRDGIIIIAAGTRIPDDFVF